ncbi:MAG: glycerol-3-phosphate acyltransferase [Treponema sp. GWB1_62_6]|nr:MAG: glycerol-3-phosphate acyltransferase [Treponema sp. GWB1_62_6]OHE67550.1 MAG: glycerol-3-phosphate acyltransferase [Treponema sp. GWA1_62_8]OHE69569.1 MAG: glycerol-3-phosphate acyltransferase [Treponema sp. GWC1_61_84]OHE76823.1 MAG: glycerol-3-phosphate acyltransferase [Treponema sp. RIFOXYC1_FULL_61_9]HCM26948.1 glycerol-3-phosphate acyltransferase [Treponema sp.]
MERISAVYRDRIMQMMGRARPGEMAITERNVRQEANTAVLPYIDGMISDLLLGGSGVDGAENLVQLYAKAKAGSSCLLLLEHYSNFDLPVFNYLVRRDLPNGDEIADAVIAIAGMKLSETNPVVTAFSEAYSRIVIYPSRSLASLDPEKDFAEFVRSNAINRAAMKALNKAKKEGKLILVFPAGTRFRPWEPESRRGVREIDSYIKSFDYMCLVSINGEILKIQPGEMSEDMVEQDIVRMEASPVIECAAFRESAKGATPDDGDKKQAVVDAIMAKLQEMHDRNEAKRPPEL